MISIKLHEIMRVHEGVLEKLEKDMKEILGKEGILDAVARDMERSITRALKDLGLDESCEAEGLVHALTARIGADEEKLYRYVGGYRREFTERKSAEKLFEKLKKVALSILSEKEGYFLKKEKAEEILRKHPPTGTIKYLKYKNVEEMLKKEDIGEIMSALRFTESDQWMHKAFDVAYSEFTPEDFEKRQIELRMLGPQWEEIGKKFVTKKHHNVSHLKEFGIVFLNPINQHLHGALFRDFALFFHYFHEIIFYSKLFKKDFSVPDFAERLKSLLRGDVPEKDRVNKGEWLIVQRYLWKENAKDPRLFLPRVNPEALHWHKGEKDLVSLGKNNDGVGFDFWDDLDWVGGYFPNSANGKSLISFDLEDNAMSYVSVLHKKGEYVKYHQQEALWNEIFRRYLGKKEMDRLLIENFNKGSIQL
jgi:hypothetical protein